MHHVGALAVRHRRAVVIVWALVLASLVPLAVSAPGALSLGGADTGTEASRAAELLRQRFPERVAPVAFVVFDSRSQPIEAPAYRAQVAAWRTDLDRLARGRPVLVAGPVSARDDRTAALLLLSNQDPVTLVALGRGLAGLHHDGPARAYVGGPIATYDEGVRDGRADFDMVERLSLPLALALLLVVFGGVVAASLPVITGLASVTMAVALVGLAARIDTVSVFALSTASIFGIGFGIDYSLLVVSRFREELRARRNVEQAVAATVGTAGATILVSGGAVAIGFGALMLSGRDLLWSIGLGGLVAVEVCVLASLTLIPALLAILGGRVDRLAIRLSRAESGGRFWSRLAGPVMARPLVFIVIVPLVLIVLMSPARHFRPGVESDGLLPRDSPPRIAERLARERFVFPADSPTLVLVRGVPDLPTAAEVETGLQEAAGGQALTGPSDVRPWQVPLYLRGGYALYALRPPAGPGDRRTDEWLDHLRAARLPAGTAMLVGGDAADAHDYLRSLGEETPFLLGAVLVATLVFLGATLRSVFLPVKAVLMNVLSVGAALGVLTWGFQDGHLGGVLDFSPSGHIDAAMPVIVFACLFGISMDYEVFLLSRIREHWMEGGATAQAVALGMDRTGRMITSAALIVVTVSSTLALGHLVANKEFGVSVGVAVLLDATLIRLLLVPAVMRVLGDYNWWPTRRSPR